MKKKGLNEILYDRAAEAIDRLFDDQSVSQGKCRKNLEALKDKIDQQIEMLDEDDE